MEITKENHLIVRVTEIATKTSVELKIIHSLINSFMHDLHAKELAGEEIVKAMDELRTKLNNVPRIDEMIRKA